jgi:hypothetical protein
VRAARPRQLSALVLGSGNSLQKDKAEALALFDPHLVIACNHAARDEPGRVDHWVTMHPDLLPMWLEQRRRAGLPEPGQLWAARHRAHRCPVETNRIENWGGSSGLLCVAVAFELGVQRIVLAGVPMSKNYAHFDDVKKWEEARNYWSAWERNLGRMDDRVRSLSGWTQMLLGSPTREWLHGD